MSENKTQQEIKNKEDEDAYRIRKGTYDLLPEADENIKKLQVKLELQGGAVGGAIGGDILYSVV